jgi:hypothetical protein
MDGKKVVVQPLTPIEHMLVDHTMANQDKLAKVLMALDRGIQQIAK